MADVAARAGMPDVHRVYPKATDNTWYPARFNAPPADNEVWLSFALQAIDRAMATLEADGVPASRTVLVGFSQGACLLSEYLVRSPRRYAAVALFTGCDISVDGTEREIPTGFLSGLPVLMSSSQYDEWVPPERVRGTAAMLERAGAEIELRIHAAREHGVNDEEIAALRRLLDTAARRRSAGPVPRSIGTSLCPASGDGEVPITG
jgi:predicted esterase